MGLLSHVLFCYVVTTGGEYFLFYKQMPQGGSRISDMFYGILSTFAVALC